MTPKEAQQLKVGDRVRYRKNGRVIGEITEVIAKRYPFGSVCIKWDNEPNDALFDLVEMGAVHKIEE